MMRKELLACVMIPAFITSSTYGRDILLEFKGAYFHPTGSSFKKIYKGAALYGPEITVQLCDDSDWYGFASVDYLSKGGYSIGLGTPTKISLLPMAIGLKYFTPVPCWECTDFYVGLGFQPVRVKIRNDSPYVIPRQTKWALGGIVKVGSYIYLPRNVFIDVFIDYSFAKLSSGSAAGPMGPIVPLKASVSGAIFGIGLGYRF